MNFKKIIKKFLNTLTGINISARKLPVDEDIKKILVISLYFAGDMLFHTAAIEALRILFPNAKIDILTKSRSAILLKNDIRFNEIIAYDGIKTSDYRHEEDINKTEFEEFFKKLNSNNYSVILDLTGKKETAKLVKKISSQYTIGLNYDYYGYCYDKFVYSDTASEKGHLISKYLNVVIRGFNVDDNKWETIKNNVKIKPYLTTDNYAVNEALNILQQNGLVQKKYISVHLTSGWPAKELPVETFSELFSKLASKGIPVLVVGDDKDKQRFNEVTGNINDKLNNYKFVNSDFNITAELIKNSELFIGSDSAPLHIAAAFEVPAIAIFGPTNPGFSAPLHDKTKIIYHQLFCSAAEDRQYCTRNGGFTCPRYDCMLSITADEIMTEIEKFLADNRENLQDA